MRFNTVVVDPPWPISMSGQKAGRHSQAGTLPYQAMSLQDIAWLPIPSLLNPGAHVYLWCTNQVLRQAFNILETWGLRYHLTMVMTKPSGMAPAMGYVFATEFCLLAFNGRPMQKFTSIGELNWFSRPSTRGTHSSKPTEFYQRVERMSPSPYADLFARQSRKGWSVWGDEVESDFEL